MRNLLHPLGKNLVFLQRSIISQTVTSTSNAANGTKNTDFGTNSTNNGTKNSERTLSDLILNRINDDNTISIQALMNATQQSKRTINRIITGLKKSGKVERIGSPRNGKWVFR